MPFIDIGAVVSKKINDVEFTPYRYILSFLGTLIARFCNILLNHSSAVVVDKFWKPNTLQYFVQTGSRSPISHLNSLKGVCDLYKLYGEASSVFPSNFIMGQIENIKFISKSYKVQKLKMTKSLTRQLT